MYTKAIVTKDPILATVGTCIGVDSRLPDYRGNQVSRGYADFINQANLMTWTHLGNQQLRSRRDWLTMAFMSKL